MREHIRKAIPAAACALVASLAIAAPAGAKVKLRVTPSSPIVDDSVTVSWRADRTLRAGYHYEGSLVAGSGLDCAGLVLKKSKRRPKKGAPMSFSFSPFDDRLADVPEWCRGRAYITVEIIKDGGKTGATLATASFRFRGKP